MIEIEKKFRLTEEQRTIVLERLPQIGATSIAEEFEENTLYGGGSLEIGTSVLRLRRAGNKAVLTFKKRLGSVSPIKYRMEIETLVEDPDSLSEILEALGFRPVLVYEKQRQTWHLDNTEILIDKLPFGLFMEIEGSEDDIHAIELKLGIDGLLNEPASYPELARRHGKPSGELIAARFDE